MLSSQISLIGFATLLLGTIMGVDAGLHHKKLLSDLFSNYDVNERPVVLDNDTVHVSFAITILNLVDVNIAQGYMEANIWLTIEWNDVHLKWEPASYGGIRTISVEAHKFWRPDIYLYNSVHTDFDPKYHTNIVLKSDGNATFIPPGIFRTSCRTDVTYYPFDQHKCTLKFGSWTLDGAKLNMSISGDEADLSSFIPNREWDVLGASGQVNTIYYGCCPEPYIDVTYVVNLKRRGDAMFSGCAFSLLIVATMTLLSLFLPTRSGQRLTLGIVSLVAVQAMAISLHNHLGGKASLMVFYFQTLALVTFISIIANVFISFFYNRNPSIYKMPESIRRVFCEVIPRFIALDRPAPRSNSLAGVGGTGNSQGQQNDQYEELVNDLQVLVQKFKGQGNTNGTVNEWQYLAMVLDRITLIGFTVFTVLYFICLYSSF